ncbi:uncharacterized protein F5147DRAFT_771418 [Suillus discolor]|uniref:KOW domain-containing protein n=1 Tax=Suillus discolor TaxID=1912936 RepID=A0A9P7JVZ5_9AGAM|nr:uncharacterized protein F5147DRAFT_771418 [Suillus discolor]KAG2112352.1 hypothetical protein F5147DRAFT_771418 [Suillus discolor]
MTASSKNLYIDTEAEEDHSEEDADANVLAVEGDGDLSAQLTNITSLRRRPTVRLEPKNPYIDAEAEEGSDDEDRDEYDSLRDTEEEDDSGPSTRSPNVTCLLGPAAKHTLATAINDIMDKYTLNMFSLSNRRLRQTAAWSPETIQSRMYLLLIYRTSTSYIAKHLRRKGFPITVSLWAQGQLYVVSDSPRTISLFLPISLRPSVKEYLYISDEEHEAVKCARLTLPSPAWVKIKTSTHHKYHGAIGYVFEESEENDNFMKVLIPPRDFPYPMPQGSVALFDLAHPLTGKLTTDIICHGKVVRWTYKGEQYYMGLLLKKFHRYLLELVVVPHPDDIWLHLQSGWDTHFVKNTELAFSMQFLREGDAARVLTGEVHSEISEVISMDHVFGSMWLKINTNGLQREIDLRVWDVERVFWVGDAVRVVVGSYLGLEGHIIGMSDEIFDVCQEDTKEEPVDSSIEVLPGSSSFETHAASTAGTATTSSCGAFPEHDPFEVGDYVQVFEGEYLGKSGIVEWFPTGSTILFLRDADLDMNVDNMEGPPLVQVPVAMVQQTCLPPIIEYTKDRGYDVKPGDFMSVVHGPEFWTTGFVHSVDFPTARMKIQSSSDYSLIEVPIRFAIMLRKKSVDEFKSVIGREVFIIRGDLKGYRATLYSIASDTCTVAIHGQRRVTLKHHDVATSVTPPPPPQASVPSSSNLNTDQGPSSSSSPGVWAPWSTSVEGNNTVLDHSSGVNASLTFDPWTANNLDDIRDCIEAEVETCADPGLLPWLMNKEFSSMLSKYHVSLRVLPSFMGGRLINQFMSTACPDLFCSVNGPAPEESIAAYCTSNSAGAALKHYHIPAKDLSPAPPCRENQNCLVLNGQYHGLVFPVAKCNVKSQTVDLILMDGTALTFTLRFDEVCLVELTQNG